MNALVIICLRPVESLCAFYNSFNEYYDVFMIIDDEHFDYNRLEKIYTNITFVSIDKSVCIENHFKNTSHLTINKEVSGWDKALYYFAIVRTEYSYIWFLEDDVYIYNINTLLNIDKKYEHYDLLSNTVYKEAKLDEWHWENIQIQFPPPYFCGMCCASRMSRNMLLSLNTYSHEYKTLFFLEACFPTIAKYFNLKILDSPQEFQTVTYNRKWDFPADFNETGIFHPIKNPDRRQMICQHLNHSST